MQKKSKNAFAPDSIEAACSSGLTYAIVVAYRAAASAAEDGAVYGQSVHLAFEGYIACRRDLIGELMHNAQIING